MCKFKVGDRVIANVNNPSYNPGIFSGDQGVVCQAVGNIIGVRWDIEIPGGHTCSSHCDFGHGWRVDPYEIDILHESEADFDIAEDAFMMAIQRILYEKTKG